MVLGLFPELNAPGGIQRAGRHLAAVLTQFASAKRWPVRILSLGDPQGRQEAAVAPLAFAYQGFARSKPRFVAAALAARHPRLVLAAHPNLAPLARVMQVIHGSRTGVVGWGIDVWDRLPWLRRSALRAADRMIAISRFTAERSVTVQKVRAEAVRLLPLALEPGFWEAAQSPAASSARADGLPLGRLLLSVSRLAANEGYKGVDTVLRALPRLAGRFPDLHYVIVGDGDDRPRLERISHQLGLDGRVHFLGRMEAASPRLMACYASCECFVLPSAGEGFGLVFLEAMAFGKPVVGGAHGGTPDVIEDGVSGFLVPHGDVARLAEVLGRVLGDDALRAHMGRRAQEHVRTNFLFPSFAARLRSILEELCAS